MRGGKANVSAWTCRGALHLAFARVWLLLDVELQYSEELVLAPQRPSEDPADGSSFIEAATAQAIETNGLRTSRQSRSSAAAGLLLTRGTVNR